MKDPDYDCIVIGGAANGAQAAISAAKSGLRVAIIEEHPTTGLPEHCSGLFSYLGLQRLNAMPPQDIIFNENITGSRIISPNGEILTVHKGEKHALVCDRAAFDRFLIEKAEKLGTTIHQPFRALKAERSKGLVSIDIKSKSGETMTLDTNMLISAEGLKGTIANQLGLETANPETIVNAAQFYLYDLEGIDKELVEVYQNQKYAKNFFAWLIPMSDNSAKIGLGTSHKAASKQLHELINNHPVLKEKCKSAEKRRTTAGRIPTYGPIKQTYSDNVLLAGDVAGQAKPTTGGGVILGGIAAEIAGKVAAQAIEKGDCSARYLKQYQKLWKKEIARNLRLMKLVRLYMNRLSDDNVNDFFSRLKRKGLLDDIEKYGDVDDQGKLVVRFMKTLSLYPFYLKTFGKLIKSIFAM